MEPASVGSWVTTIIGALAGGGLTAAGAYYKWQKQRRENEVAEAEHKRSLTAAEKAAEVAAKAAAEAASKAASLAPTLKKSASIAQAHVVFRRGMDTLTVRLLLRSSPPLVAQAHEIVVGNVVRVLVGAKRLELGETPTAEISVTHRLVGEDVTFLRRMFERCAQDCGGLHYELRNLTLRLTSGDEEHTLELASAVIALEA